MSPALIVPGVARFSVNGTYLGIPVANILDMHLDVGGLTSRGDACADQAHIIVSAWVNHVCQIMSNAYAANTVSWVDMNSADGSTGEVSDGTGSDFPQGGGSGGAQMPGMVSYLIHKQITASRGARQGRMFLTGVTEDHTPASDGNHVTGTWVTSINGFMGSFLSDINQESGVSGAIYDSDLVVVHTRNTGTPEDPIITYTGRSHVDALLCDTKLHSQRRRMG